MLFCYYNFLQRIYYYYFFFFHKKKIFFHVPECSGTLRVSGFIEGRHA